MPCAIRRYAYPDRGSFRAVDSTKSFEQVLHQFWSVEADVRPLSNMADERRAFVSRRAIQADRGKPLAARCHLQGVYPQVPA